VELGPELFEQRRVADAQPEGHPKNYRNERRRIDQTTV
jgi:hypothetical protein